MVVPDARALLQNNLERFHHHRDPVLRKTGFLSKLVDQLGGKIESLGVGILLDGLDVALGIDLCCRLFLDTRGRLLGDALDDVGDCLGVHSLQLGLASNGLGSFLNVLRCHLAVLGDTLDN